MSQQTRKGKLDEARNTITRVLQAMNVGCVVAVDDEWLPDDPALIIAAEPGRVIGDINLDFEAEYETEIRRMWDDIPAQDLIDLRARSAKKRPDLITAPLDILAYLCSGHGSFRALSPDSWDKEQQEKLLTKYTPAGMLVLFDRYINGNPDVGEGMLKEFLKAQGESNAAMVTTETSYEEELEDQARIAEAIGVAPEQVLLASKDHLTVDNCGRFADFLRHAVNAKYLRAIRDQVLELAKAGHTTAIGELEQMSLRVLEDIVLRSSRIEGAYEVDTMLRALNIEVTAAVGNQLADGKAAELQETVEAARHLAAASFLDDEASHRKAEELLAKERFETEDTVNRGGLPVQNGDVFEVDGAAYLLFEPPCDMVMRDNVSESRDHKHAKLVELQPAGTRKRVWKLPRHPPFGLGEELDANFAEHLSLPLRILDLCSFNTDGRARIDLSANQPEIAPLTPGLARRYEQLTTMARNLMEVIDQVPQHLPEVRARLLLVDDLQGEVTDDTIEWPVRRLGRLARSVAAAGLAAESADASRPANLHDLDLFESAEGTDEGEREDGDAESGQQLPK